MSTTTIADAADEAARPQQAAAHAVGGPAVTSAELSDRSWRLAHALHRPTVRRGDRIGVFIRSSIEHPVVMFAAATAAAVHLAQP